MAWSFESGDYVTLDLDGVSIPDGSWSFSALIYFDNLSPGYTYNFIAAPWFLGYNSVICLRFFNGGTPQALFIDDDGTNKNVSPYSNYWFSTGTWYQLGIRRVAGSSVGLMVDGNQVWDSGNDSSLNGIADVGEFRFANDSNTFLGKIAEPAFWNRALTDEEWEHLGADTVSDFYAPSHYSPDWYCPAIDDYSESVHGYTVTNNGASIYTHPTVIYPVTLPSNIILPNSIIASSNLTGDISDIAEDPDA